MRPRLLPRALPAALLAAFAAGCSGPDDDVTAAAPAPSASEQPSWEDRVLPSDWELPSTTPEAQAAAGLVSEVFADPSRDAIWAKYHYTDGGDGVIVNLVAGWEDTVVGPEIQRVIATAPAPVEVREVAHSNQELMHGFMDIADTDPVIVGAALTSATVDPELNALVIGLTEIDEESVAAVVDLFGPDVFVRQEEQAQATAG